MSHESAFRRVLEATKYKFQLLSVAIVLGSAVAAVFFISQETEIAIETKARLVRYSFTLSNQTNRAVDQALFTTFAPVKKTAYQKVDWVKASEAFETKIDDYGNQELEFVIQDIPPFGTKVITISVQLAMSEAPHDQPDLAYERTLTPLVDPEQISLRQSLDEIGAGQSSDDDIAWMKAANAWVYKNLEDVGYVSEDRGAVFALTERKGDCTEFMHAVVALARAQHIPALPVAGFRVQGQNSILSAVDYHNWALFKTDDAWRLADPHGNVFETNQSDYVAFRLLLGQSGHGENSQRFFIHDPRVNVSMN